jgi:hypothetical protein
MCVKDEILMVVCRGGKIDLVCIGLTCFLIWGGWLKSESEFGNWNCVVHGRIDYFLSCIIYQP